MTIRADYLGMSLTLDDLEVENREFFRHCGAHDFHLQRCLACDLLHYPPGAALPVVRRGRERVGRGRGQGHGAFL